MMMMFPSRLFIFLTFQLLSYNHNMVTAQCHPTNLETIQVSSTQLTMSWRCFDRDLDDELQVTYRLYNRGQCDAGDGSEDPPFDSQTTQWDTWNRPHINGSTYEHSATLTDLLPYSTYNVSVQARQPDGAGGYNLGVVTSIDPDPTTSEAAPGAFGAERIVYIPLENKLYFCWGIPCGSRNGLITGYQYVLRDVSSNAITGHNTTIQRDTIVYGLSCDTTYRFHVAGINSAGIGAYSEYKTATTTCCTREHGPVGNLKTTSISATEIRLSWAAPVDIGCLAKSNLEYMVAYTGENLQSGCTLLSQDSVTIQDLDYTLSSLIPYYEYTIGVFAVGGEANRQTITISTPQSVPGAVQTLRITAASSTSLDVSWNAPINECPPDFYTVATQLTNRDQCLPIPDVLIPAGSPTGLSYQVTGLIPYSTYTLYVTPVNTAGNGVRSDVSGTTSQTEPLSGPPVNVMVSDVGQRYLSFTWMQPMCGERKGDIMKYSYMLTDLYRNTVMLSDTSNTSIVLTDLTPYVRYGFKVSAWTSVGQGPFSDLIVKQTLEDKPPAPLKPTVANADTMSITFHWLSPDPPNGVIIGYDVQYWDTTNNMMSAYIENTIFMEYIVTGLKANDQISFQVRAETSAGKGNWSEVATGEAKEGIPDPPTDFTVSSIGETSVTLHWNLPTNQNGVIQSYTIEYRVVERAYDPTFSPDEEYIIDVAGNADTRTIENLDPSSKYEFKISARTSVGIGISTPSIEVFTKPFTGLNQPNSPAVKIVNGVGIIVFNDLPEFVSNVYIAVEKANGRRRRQVGKHPLHAFIVANLTRREVDESMTFTVGDNKTYGGYVNHALIGGQSYGIKVAFASCTPEGCLEEWSSLSIFTAPSGTFNQSGTINLLGPVIGGVVAVILVAVVLFALICYYRRNKASTKETPKETAKDENEIYDEIDPKKEMMAKQLQRSQTEETGYEVNMAMETKMSPRAQSDGSAYEDVNIKEEAEYQGLNLDAVDEEQTYQDLKGNASGDKSAPQYANV